MKIMYLNFWYKIKFLDINVLYNVSVKLGFPVGSDGKESSCNAGDLGLIPGLGRSPEEGNGKPLQYSSLENPMDRGTWRAVVHGVTKSQTWLKWLSTHMDRDIIGGDLISLGASLEAQMVKNLPAMQETWVRSLGWEDPLEKGMATHSRVLAWRIPWTEEPDGL